MEQNTVTPDDEYRPNFALGVVVLTAVILTGLMLGLRAVWGF